MCFRDFVTDVVVKSVEVVMGQVRSFLSNDTSSIKLDLANIRADLSAQKSDLRLSKSSAEGVLMNTAAALKADAISRTSVVENLSKVSSQFASAASTGMTSRAAKDAIMKEVVEALDKRCRPNYFESLIDAGAPVTSSGPWSSALGSGGHTKFPSPSQTGVSPLASAPKVPLHSLYERMKKGAAQSSSSVTSAAADDALQTVTKLASKASCSDLLSQRGGVSDLFLLTSEPVHLIIHCPVDFCMCSACLTGN